MPLRLSRLFFALSATLAIPILSASARGEDSQSQALPEVANSKYQFSGTINAPGVQIRSGPGDNYYPTMKLEKGTGVTVVGYKFDWLKITPPEGSFSVVAKIFIAAQADGKTGVVTADPALNVRAGSDLSTMKVTMQCKLPKGTVVQILGEVDEYYKIKPPAEAFVYVHQKYVEPGKPVGGAIARAAPIKSTAKQENAPAPGIVEPNEPQTSSLVAEKTITPPAETVAIAPATRPAGPSSEDIFDRLEAQFKSVPQLKLIDQPLPTLLTGYEDLLKDDHLPSTMRQVAMIRVAVLTIQNQRRQDLTATLKSQGEAEARLNAIETAKATLEQRMLANGAVYTAVGLLQGSSVQAGGQPLCRLTDPATGRTLCYVRIGEAKIGGFLEKFVGVKGDLTSDPQLSFKVIPATDIVIVDPAAVNKSVTAQVVPPSLIGPGTPASQANTGNN